MYRLKLLRSMNEVVQTCSKQKCVNLNGSNCWLSLSATKISQNKYSNITSNSKQLPHAATISNKPNEQEYLVRLKNDPDVFGDSAETESFDSHDLKEDKYLEEQPAPSQKLRTSQYGKIIKSLITRHKIKEALDVLETKMLKDDRVKPENYIFNLLLGACGRVGYTKKAFMLYNDMKKRGLKVTGGTYTALFNACANSPWPEDGLTRANHLRNIMIEKMYEPNETNYNVMIKAFGRCGDLTTAFSLVDEMISKKHCLKDETINFLLQGCIQDKDAGFRHALLVWRKLIDRNIAPSLYSYNLILRCIRDCGIGDIELMNETLKKILNPNNLQLTDKSVKLLEENRSRVEDIHSEQFTEKSDLQLVEAKDSPDMRELMRPNLIGKVPYLGNIISISEITKPEERLLLVGGFKGFLNNMSESQCTPNVKTFTQLLDCLPGSLAAENELRTAMKKLNVKPDIDFFNMLIKKRSMRCDYESAKDVLKDMKKMSYKPNLLTYGVLALGCKTKKEASDLLDEMKLHSYRLNTEILGAMLHQGCYHYNFPYVLEIMEISIRENVKPNQKFMQRLEDFKKKCKVISNDKDHNLSQDVSFQKGYRIFRMRYKTWLSEVEIDNSDKTHPWTQYRETTETDVRHYKDPAVRFKPKHLSKFKVKTKVSAKNK